MNAAILTGKNNIFLIFLLDPYSVFASFFCSISSTGQTAKCPILNSNHLIVRGMLLANVSFLLELNFDSI
jgi:hypothetical protein